MIFPSRRIRKLIGTSERLPLGNATILLAVLSNSWVAMVKASWRRWVTISALVTVLFLGGWVGIGNGIFYTVTQTPWFQLLGVFWFMSKVAFFLFTYIWVRATLPRDPGRSGNRTRMRSSIV